MVLFKHKLKIDDALDVSSVHGVTGIIGSLSIGFASQQSLNPSGADGLLFGNPKLLGIQCLAVVVAAVWSAFWTFVICYILKRTIGLTISEEEEEKGLDLVEHGEFGEEDIMK